jgi:hypothetical protein
MLKVKAQRVVNTRVDKVFNYLTDFARHPEWVCEWTVLAVDKSSEGPIDVGSTFRMRYRGGISGYAISTCAVEVKEFVPDQRLVFDVFRTAVAVVRYSINLEPVVGSARITMRHEYLLPSLLAKALLPLMLLVTPILWPLSFWNLTRELRRIKSRVEAEE